MNRAVLERRLDAIAAEVAALQLGTSIYRDSCRGLRWGECWAADEVASSSAVLLGAAWKDLASAAGGVR